MIAADGTNRLEDGRILYAIVYTRTTVVGRDMHVESLIDNLHATDALAAKVEFIRSMAPNVRNLTNIIAIAPVVGYHAEESRGKILLFA